jgi:metal transporter CNNM
MVPAPRLAPNAYPHSSRLLYTLLSVGTQHVPGVFRRSGSSSSHECGAPFSSKCIAFATLIPVLVLLSGVFAGLTLGYMSMDETQLNVLSISGTPYVDRSLTVIITHVELQPPTRICQQDQAYP